MRFSNNVKCQNGCRKLITSCLFFPTISLLCHCCPVLLVDVFFNLVHKSCKLCSLVLKLSNIFPCYFFHSYKLTTINKNYLKCMFHTCYPYCAFRVSNYSLIALITHIAYSRHMLQSYYCHFAQKIVSYLRRSNFSAHFGFHITTRG